MHLRPVVMLEGVRERDVDGVYESVDQRRAGPWRCRMEQERHASFGQPRVTAQHTAQLWKNGVSIPIAVLQPMLAGDDETDAKNDRNAMHSSQRRA